VVVSPSSTTGPVVQLSRVSKTFSGMVRRNVEPSISAISTIILLVTTALIYPADRLARDK
jgi:ABC-type spermidine/putrescine transport system permease subunit II